MIDESPPPLRLLQLPDEVLGLILYHLLPPSQRTTFPPRHPRSFSYTNLSQSWTSSNRPPPWPHPPVPRSLSAFTLVSKRANQLAARLLYNAIHLHTIVSTNQLALTLERNQEIGTLVRHLHLPNDGLLHGASDRMADRQKWVESIRTILHSMTRLETLSIATRPGGEVLQEVFHFASKKQGGMKSLKRATISSLSFSFPALGAGCLNACNLTHLHLIQWIPPTLSERFGSTIHQSLRAIRLSRIPSSAALRIPLGNVKGASAQQMFDESIRVAPQPLLLLLRECMEQCHWLQTVLLEMEQLSDLDLPESLTSWEADEGELPASAPNTTALDSTAAAAAALQDDESRCEQRLQHWSRLENFKHLLLLYSQEMSTDKSRRPMEIRIVAPRTLGWDRNESLMDFYANASACRGETDCSAFQDEDVFELVRQHPHLGLDYARDQAGNKVAYWTGALPRPASQQQ